MVSGRLTSMSVIQMETMRLQILQLMYQTQQMFDANQLNMQVTVL